MGIFSTTVLDKQITLVRPVQSDDFDGAGSETYEDVATVRANIQEVLPSRSERMAEVVNVASRPARIRIRYLENITSDMRILYGSRTMEIVSGPAELGRREGLEIMVEEYSTSGGGG